MGLQNLFEMAKADRYTADGREELEKAREADVEDRKYQIGEISTKTGLQKTANGWVKPKSGKQPGAKKEEGNSITGANGNLSERAKFAYESNAKKLSTEGLESVIRNKDKVFAKHNDEIAEIYKKELAKRNARKVESKAPKMTPEQRKKWEDKAANGWVKPKSGGASKGADVSLASKDVKEVAEKIKPSDGAEKAELSKITQFMDEEKSSLKNAIEGRESFYKNTKNPTPEQEAGLAALLRIKNKIGKQPETGASGEKKNISYREMGEGPLYVKKQSSDSAPRVLTGDCKVRIRK